MDAADPDGIYVHLLESQKAVQTANRMQLNQEEQPVLRRYGSN